MDQDRHLELHQEDGATVISLAGSWRIEALVEIDAQIDEQVDARTAGKGARAPRRRRESAAGDRAEVVIDGSRLDHIDTAGALLALRIPERLGIAGAAVTLRGFAPRHRRLVDLVERHMARARPAPRAAPPGGVQEIGRWLVTLAHDLAGLISFLGESLVVLFSTLRRPRTFRWREFMVQLQHVAIEALPIVSLVMLLIGIVVAYLLAAQIEQYGADIYIVDGVSIAICRELSPIIVAIIMAGRSGSAFTAQIGTIKLNEELDAIIALGLQPMRVLVLPRMLALVAALPLLVILGNTIGILGGVLVAKGYLDIGARTFVERLREVLAVKHVVVGAGKAPVFAAFIALIGCRMGLTVERNARSIGLHTTSTVVQSIVAVILLDAGFAVILQELGV